MPSVAGNKGRGGVLKQGPLKTAIEADFGSLDVLKKEFNATMVAIQGSGEGWLVHFFRPRTLLVDERSALLSVGSVQGFNPKSKRLEIVTTANQDPLLSHIPIVSVDIWEHAFSLQYLNVKVKVSGDQPVYTNGSPL